MIINNPVPLRGLNRHAGSKFKKFRSNKIVATTSYILIFGLIVGLAYTGRDSDSLVLAERQDQQITTTVTDEKPSIDQVVATDLAADLAERVDLPIANNVANQAISFSAKSQLAQTNDETISKPQIVASTASASSTFTTYKAQPGDTAQSVAKKFGLEADTIRWANGLAGDAIEPGRRLLIPPVHGIVYGSHAGDTAASIAQRFNGNANRVILYNDLEGARAIPAGTKLIVPGGSPAAVAAVARSGGSSVISSNILAGLSGGNRYDYGYCTWYAYNRRAALGMPIGGMGGNASSWASLARASGFSVSNSPGVGAVMQTANAAGGYGHVAVVESINSDGSLLVSEMNYAGWNVKSTRKVPAGSVGSYSYIH